MLHVLGGRIERGKINALQAWGDALHLAKIDETTKIAGGEQGELDLLCLHFLLRFQSGKNILDNNIAVGSGGGGCNSGNALAEVADGLLPVGTILAVLIREAALKGSAQLVEVDGIAVNKLLEKGEERVERLVL